MQAVRMVKKMKEQAALAAPTDAAKHNRRTFVDEPGDVFQC
jgi:hypothetical protein